jgi:deoxyribodipyrimidine photo-lyase
VWFRLDLRLADNLALRVAAQRGGPVVPVYIWAPEEDGNWPLGGASRWWLHQSLHRLAAELEKAGTRLIIRRGNSLQELLSLAKETGANAVFWNRRYEPAARLRDKQVSSGLVSANIEVQHFNSALLFEPDSIQNNAGKPFRVFTPFWRNCLRQAAPAEPDPAPKRLPAPRTQPASLVLNALALEPQIDWAQGMREFWTPGSRGATKRLQTFLEHGFFNYSENRNRPDLDGTSQLSPHFHFGEISPRQVWKAIRDVAEPRLGEAWRKSQFITELGWREFAHHLLFHFPDTIEHPLRPEFARFPWRNNLEWLRAWQRGRTGFPMVDAGMRQLWEMGWMHNRVRMVVASFLVKNLLINWVEGARWFWDTLVDADLANNTLGWQWTAGCGADASPFFRIFNPVSQGEKFDPEGHYVRRWIPELSWAPLERIHIPRGVSSGQMSLAGFGVRQTAHGEYPPAIVSLFTSRELALEAYGRLNA